MELALPRVVYTGPVVLYSGMRPGAEFLLILPEKTPFVAMLLASSLALLEVWEGMAMVTEC